MKIRKTKALSSEQHNDVFQWYQELELHYELADFKTDVWREKNKELGICNSKSTFLLFRGYILLWGFGGFFGARRFPPKIFLV